MARHPAKFTDKFIPIFAEYLNGSAKIIDPMAGTGKIGLIKKHGFNGVIYANDLEMEWVSQSIENGCDLFSVSDAANLPFEDDFFDGVCTSPTYGNRMADCHEAKDGSKRNTYTHAIGRKLHNENTGKMQWGENYKNKHIAIYKEVNRITKQGGIFILNIKDHIRKGEIVEVSEYHKSIICSLGFELQEIIKVKVAGNGFGQNGKLRVDHENIFIFKKTGRF